MSKKPIDVTISPNLEQTNLLLSGLDALEDKEKSKVTYQRLHKQLEAIKTIHRRREKNDKIIEAKNNGRNRRNR